MTAWLFRCTRFCWWISALCPEDFYGSTHTYTLLSTWEGGDQHPFWEREGIQEGPLIIKWGQSSRIILDSDKRGKYVKTTDVICCMLKFLSCWSSHPGHQVCRSPALPCWPSFPGHPAGDAMDQEKLGGDKQGCNNFHNVSFVFKDNKMKRSYKCCLQRFEKITELIENIAKNNWMFPRKRYS